MIIKKSLQEYIMNDLENLAPPVHSIDEIKARLSAIEFKGVRKLSLFGSFAKGTQNNRSDIDLLIECDNKIDQLLLAECLEKILGRLCDVVELEACPPWIKFDILNDSIIDVYINKRYDIYE